MAEETAANKAENRKNLRDNMELIHEIKELRLKIGHYKKSNTVSAPRKNAGNDEQLTQRMKEKNAQTEEIRKLCNDIDMLEGKQKRIPTGTKLEPLDKY